MASPYANAVETYGRSWRGPWCAILFVAAVSIGFHAFFQRKSATVQVICTPRPDSHWHGAVNIGGLFWTADLDAALQCAQENRRYVVVAFHAVCDANAAIHEKSVFQSRDVQCALQQHVLVMMHTDAVPKEFYRQIPSFDKQRADAHEHLKFQVRTLDTEQEPMYVVLQPTRGGDFRILRVFAEGRINEPGQFVDFLNNPHRR